MIQVTLNLYEGANRPIVDLKNSVLALLDTGAVIPVWFDGEDDLKEVYDANLIKEDVEISGLGGKVIGGLYEIPTFKLGSFIYPHLPIIVCKEEIEGENRKNENDAKPYSMLLSATMFKECICEIDTINYKLNIETHDNCISRNISVYDSNGRIHVFCTFGDEEPQKGGKLSGLFKTT